jgi:hypothetical protein
MVHFSRPTRGEMGLVKGEARARGLTTLMDPSTHKTEIYDKYDMTMCGKLSQCVIGCGNLGSLLNDYHK